MAESPDESDGSTGRSFLAPISGLLAVVFAVMAGATLSNALTGPPEEFLLPVALGAASVGCMLLRQRLL
jgi:hypothetical protein